MKIIKFIDYLTLKIWKSFIHMWIIKYIDKMKAPITLKDNDGNCWVSRIVLMYLLNMFDRFLYSKDNDFLPHFEKRSNVLLSNVEIDFIEVHRRLRILHYPVNLLVALIIYLIFYYKNLHSPLALPLSSLFQRRISTACLLKLWKCAKIVQIYKGNYSKYYVENYRPISFISTVIKVLWKVLSMMKLISLCNK